MLWPNYYFYLETQWTIFVEFQALFNWSVMHSVMVRPFFLLSSNSIYTICSYESIYKIRNQMDMSLGFFGALYTHTHTDKRTDRYNYIYWFLVYVCWCVLPSKNDPIFSFTYLPVIQYHRNGVLLQMHNFETCNIGFMDENVLPYIQNRLKESAFT